MCEALCPLPQVAVKRHKRAHYTLISEEGTFDARPECRERIGNESASDRKQITLESVLALVFCKTAYRGCRQSTL